MRVELMTPLKGPAKIRVTYNEKELFTREFAEGETPKLAFDTPQESGHAKAFLIVGDGPERPIGMASYYFDDIVGAQMLIKDGNTLAGKNKNWAARTRLLKAISLLGKLAPDSEEMADAYLSMSMVYFFSRSRKHKVAQRRQEALAWYEKALAVWERNGDVQALGGNLTNISSMYTRVGDLETALARASRGLEVERNHPTPADSPSYGERVHAWSHVAGCYLALGKLSEAEAVIADGLERFSTDPNRGYLWGLQARVHEARATICRQTAEEILPVQHCSI